MSGVNRSCPNCETKMPISLKKCRNCGKNLQKRKLDGEDIEKLAKKYQNTPFHHLKKVIKHRADIMFAKGSEIVIMGFHHNEERGTLWLYSPVDSIGEEFLGAEQGMYAAAIFKQYVLAKKQGKKNRDEHHPDLDTGNTVVQPDLDSGDAMIQPDLDSGDAMIQPDLDSGNSVVQPDLDSGNSVVQPDLETRANTEEIPSVTYIVNGLPVAVGRAHQNRTVIHGKAVPSDSICVQISALKRQAPAPIVFDASVHENLFLTVGCFYCIPKKDLLRNVATNGRGRYVFEAFVAT